MMTQHQLDRLGKLATKAEELSRSVPELSRSLLWALTDALEVMAIFGNVDHNLDIAEDKITTMVGK
jgi:hypothetical protein